MRELWEEPVTGSSVTPTFGAKKRDTKSQEVPLAVTAMPTTSFMALSLQMRF